MEPLERITRKVSQKVSLLSPQKKKLLSQLNTLKKIAAEAKEFRELLGTQSSKDNRAPTSKITSALLDHKVFGFDEFRDDIIKFLLDEQGVSSLVMSYSIVAITGISGAGKTTLARYVYHDKRVEENFGIRMWLSLSSDKNVEGYTREMIEFASKQECPNLHNKTVLQNKLIETLSKSERILIVLDDVRYDPETETEKQQWDDQQWDDLLAPFVSIRDRCKIMVTSCHKHKTLFPNALAPRKLIELSDMSPNDFRSLFMYYAMEDLEISDPQLKNNLCAIGVQIAAKMSKSPLAAKVVSYQLRKDLDEGFWLETLNNNNLRSTIKVLLWNYQHLDVQLQRCFLFCGVFTRTTWYTGNDLVQYWVALDFIQSSGDDRNLDDIGFEYFNKMVANSIFQLVDGKYYMHDLFRDLVEELSLRDCFRVTNFEKEIPSTVVHAYINVNIADLKKNKSSICNLRNLRALIIDIPFSTDEDINEVFSMVSKNFKNLRVLDIWSWALKKLPSIVGDLRNLRYLNVWHWQTSMNLIEKLPDSLSRLYHLQFVILPISIKTLPTKLSDLVKLRSVGKYDKDFNLLNTIPPIPYLGKLTSLQSLSEFHVRKEKGHELRQLGSLKEIAGSLRIVNLNNVRLKNDAVEARLIEKSKLIRLELVWAESSENGSDFDVIEALQPGAYLEDLSIEGYGGSRCPSWLLEGSLLNHIKHLKFYNCSALTNFPPIYQLCPYLTELRVSKCPRWIFVCENEVQVNDNEGTMGECPLLSPVMYNKLKLKNVFHHEVQSFKKTDPEQNCGRNLKIIERAAEDDVPRFQTDVWSAWWKCHQQRLNFIFRGNIEANKLILPSKLQVFFISFCSISDAALSDCLRGMATLKELDLEGIMTITTLPSVEVLKGLHNLRDLTIKNCWCLRSFGGLHALPNLEKLILDTCWNLKMKSDCTELPPTLQSFIIEACEVSQFLLLDKLQFLGDVQINNSSSLMDLSFDHLTSLKNLDLFNCPRLHHIQSSAPPSFIDTLSLLQLPNLDLKSVLKTWKGCRRLIINSSTILNELQLQEKFDAIQNLIIQWCDEDAISFEKSDHLLSIKILGFDECELKHLPSTLRDFCNLETIWFYKCSRISSLPELPKSVQQIEIENCPELKKTCQPNGSEWHKIQHIQYKFIE